MRWRAIHMMGNDPAESSSGWDELAVAGARALLHRTARVLGRSYQRHPSERLHRARWATLTAVSGTGRFEGVSGVLDAMATLVVTEIPICRV